MSALKPCALIKDIHCFRSIDSTSNHAHRLAEKGAPEGILVISEEQTAGRGRLGRTWISPPGTGLWFSLLLRPGLRPARAALITPLAAVALSRAIGEVSGLKAGIKWPNDILIRGKKAAGILTELSADLDLIRYVILGIGINVNTGYFPEEIREEATSLRLSSGRLISRTEILLSVLIELGRRYLSFVRTGKPDTILSEYRRLSATIGERVFVPGREGGGGAVAVDITANGGLLIKKADGTAEEIISGEIQHQIFPGRKPCLKQEIAPGPAGADSV